MFPSLPSFFDSAYPAAPPGSSVFIDLINYNSKGAEYHFEALLSHFTNASNLLFQTNRGLMHKILNDKSSQWGAALHDAGFRYPTAFGCVFRYLFR